MSLFVASINSGSNGNCYYVGNEQEAVLVDAGLSCRETEKRMKRIGLQMETVKALFISHEHGDHIRGVESISSKWRLPVYVTPPTLQKGRMRISAELVYGFKAYEPVSIGGLEVLAFPKYHDASDPHSFVVSGSGVHIGVFTDIGAPCAHVIANFKKCNAVFLEANYDEQMLADGRYPYHLKRRISSGHGHLSNRQAFDLFVAHRPKHLSHIYLSHLSKDNNCPEMAYELFMSNAGSTHIVVASRDQETSVYEITASAPPRSIAKTIKTKAPVRAVQTSLF